MERINWPVCLCNFSAKAVEKKVALTELIVLEQISSEVIMLTLCDSGYMIFSVISLVEV